MRIPNRISALAARVTGAFRRVRDDRRGIVAVTTALLGTALVGGTAIAVDVAFWRYRQAALQSAADAVVASAVYDLVNGVSSQTTLATNAVFEARRNGCSTGCSTAVVWPFNGDSNAVQVTLTEGSARRFFSVIYDTSAKTLRGRAVAVKSGGGTVTSRYDTACILTLFTSGEGIKFFNGQSPSNPNGVNNPNCEVIANSTSSNAITVENNSQIAGRATTPGNILQRNNWTYIGSYNTGAAPVADPYVGKVNLPTRAAAPSCADPIQGQEQKLEIYGDRGPVDMGRTQGSTPFIRTGSNTWSVTGGGRWCRGWNMQNITLNVGPGTYIVDGAWDMSNVTVNANSAGGATFILGNYSGNFNWNTGGSTFNFVAPPQGSTLGIPGIVLSTYADDTSNQIVYIDNGTKMYFTGAIYLPRRPFYVQNGGRIQAISGQTGCGHVIAGQFIATNDVTIGNNCNLSMGVQPFGTQASASGWGGTITTGTGGGGRPVFTQ